MYLIQAVLGEAALAHPPIGGLDVRSGELPQRDIAEILAQAPNVELIALVGAGLIRSRVSSSQLPRRTPPTFCVH